MNTKNILLGILAYVILASCTPREKQSSTSDTPDAPAAVLADTAQADTLAPDFTLPGPDGRPVSLSGLRGQYVVIDFWGTWCKWCVKGIPDMKRYYEKYPGRFEILSVDFGDAPDTWREAIRQHGMTWLHAITDDASARQLAEQYALEGFPTKVVVGPTGRILHTTVGESPEFYRYLDDLFGPKR